MCKVQGFMEPSGFKETLEKGLDELSSGPDVDSVCTSNAPAHVREEWYQNFM
jgi:hypothetical protein